MKFLLLIILVPILVLAAPTLDDCLSAQFATGRCGIGQFTYLPNPDSQTVAANIISMEKKIDLRINPNPVRRGNLSINAPRSSGLVIYSIDGSFVKKYDLKAGANRIRMGSFGSGVYILKFLGINQSRKIIVLH